MTITRQQWTSDGTQVLYVFNFPKIDLQTDVYVEINNVITPQDSVDYPWSFANENTVEFVTAPPAGTKIEIFRDTDIDELAYVFYPGSSIRAKDLNENFQQLLYSEQETLETIIDEIDEATIRVDQIEPLITEELQNAGEPTSDGSLFTSQAAATRFDTFVQTETPLRTDYEVGKTWLQNDVNNTLSIWDGDSWNGVASGGTFTSQPTTIYVDSVNGDDIEFDGHRIINPMKTIKAAVAQANTPDGNGGFIGDGWIIYCAPGIYEEIAPIEIRARNLSIIGASIRSTFIHPTTATQTQTMFLVDSGFYLSQFTIAGIKAEGTRGTSSVDDGDFGLPATQGWVAAFRPGCIIRKSPYIQNCTNFADESIDNDNFDPNNLQGEAGDVASGPTGGGILCDGFTPALESPLRSFVVDAFTQIALGGPGILCTNNGYAQLVSFFGTFCWYHAKARNGGQLNLSNCTTDFGEYGLIADGKSTDPVITGSVVGDYPANTEPSGAKVEIALTGLTAQSNFKTNQPGATQVVTIGSQTYMILTATEVVGGQCTITLLNPYGPQRNLDLGLIDAVSNGATAEFRLQSYISTGGHTFEFVGSGTDYRAHPDYGGRANEANQFLELGGSGSNAEFNGGKVWLSATDEEGNFKVGDVFEVDQKTGFVSIDPQSVSINLVSDLTPELGGDLDVNGKKIVGDYNGGDGDIVLKVTGTGIVDVEGTSAIKVPAGDTSQQPAAPQAGMIRFNTEEEQYEGYDGEEWSSLGGLAPEQIGTNPEQIPLNQYLGKQAFVDSVGTLRPYYPDTTNSNYYSVPVNAGDIQFRYISDTSLRLVTRGTTDPSKLYFVDLTLAELV